MADPPSDSKPPDRMGRKGATYEVVFGQAGPRSLGKLPHLLGDSLRLVWQSGKREFLTSSILTVLSSLGIAAEVLLVRNLLGSILGASRAGQNRNLTGVFLLLLLMGAIIALVSAASNVQFELTRILGDLVNRETARRVLDVAALAPLQAFDTADFHDRLQRADMGAGMRPFQITQSLLGMVGGLAGVIGILVAILILQPLLLPLLLLSLIPIWFVAAGGSRAFYRFSFGMTPNDRRRAYLRRTLTSRENVKEVIAFNLQPLIRGMWERLYAERIAELRALVRQRLPLALLGALGTSLLTIGPIALMAWLVVGGRMTLPQALAGAAAMIILGPNLGRLIFSAAQLYESSLFLEDYSAFLDLKPELEAARPTGAAPSAFSKLVGEGVSFTYPSSSTPALHNVSLEINKAEVIALVGENGSGKTTLAKLLSGLYRPSEGRICWDGVDIADVDPAELSKSVAVIFQDFVRYMLTAAQNIGVGRPSEFADLEAIRQAAVQAGADPFLSGLPQGYETLLGPEFEGGTELSTGQWQRVALARAFFRDAPFIILDEPTAALDARSEYELFQSIRALCKGRAVLLISHRFSTVRSADRIYVLKEGSLVESGTHEQLMSQQGLYAELFSLQASAYWDLERPVR